jgi:hypothetical protein
VAVEPVEKRFECCSLTWIEKLWRVRIEDRETSIPVDRQIRPKVHNS